MERGRTLVSLKAQMRRLPSWRHRWAMRPAVGDRAGGARRTSDARRTPVERKKQDRGQRRGERGVAVAVCVSFSPRKLRSRRFAIASNVIHIIVTIVTGVGAPGSACWLLFQRAASPPSVSGGRPGADDVDLDQWPVEEGGAGGERGCRFSRLAKAFAKRGMVCQPMATRQNLCNKAG